MISFKQLERIYANDSSRLKFITALQHFLLSKRDIIPPGILSEVPVYSGKPLDLYELFHQVDRREGFDRVNYMNRWQEIIDVMKLQTSPLSLRECYVKYLRLFEEAIRKKAQQHQQQQPLHLQQQQQQFQQQQQQSNPPLAPRPPTRALDTPDLSAMPPQKRPRPEMAAGSLPGTPQPPNSNISRQPVQRAQSVPSSQVTPNSYSMSSIPNMSTSSNASGSIIVSSGHINTAIKSLLSSDQNSIKQGLNYLMQLSLEGDNTRNILFVEKYPTLITALGTLLDAINPFTKLLFTLTSRDLLDPAFNISQYLLSGNDRADIFWNQTNPLDHDNVLQV